MTALGWFRRLPLEVRLTSIAGAGLAGGVLIAVSSPKSWLFGLLCICVVTFAVHALAMRLSRQGDGAALALSRAVRWIAMLVGAIAIGTAGLIGMATLIGNRWK